MDNMKKAYLFQCLLSLTLDNFAFSRTMSFCQKQLLNCLFEKALRLLKTVFSLFFSVFGARVNEVPARFCR